MDIGTPELIIVLVIVLLIFGPGRIIKISRELGASLRQFRKGLEESDQTEKQDKA